MKERNRLIREVLADVRRDMTDEEILAAQKLLGRTCGVFGEPAGVTGTAAPKRYPRSAGSRQDRKVCGELGIHFYLCCCPPGVDGSQCFAGRRGL